MTNAILVTAQNPGAVAVIQLTGDGVIDSLTKLTGIDDWQPQRVRLVRFGEIDDGLAVILRDDWAQIMPHGGPRVVTLIMQRLTHLGAIVTNDADAMALYPEADSPIEADMLLAISRAASPAAIDLLLKQPALWREALRTSDRPSPASVLDHLIEPPSVVVVGAPNVGKSTLTNRMLGRAASVVADLPGTTRDWVAGLAEIHGIAVRWLDTPGLRDSDDAIEQQAITLAADAVAQAEVLIAMRDANTDWPALPRDADLWVINKADDAATMSGDSVPGVLRTPDSGESGLWRRDALQISALHGRNIAALEAAILRCLGLDAIDGDTLWAFSPTLRKGEVDEAYVGRR